MDTKRALWQLNPYRRKIGKKPHLAATNAQSAPLDALQRRYRAALSGAVVAKARYLAQVGEAFATAISIERARWRWQRMEACRLRLAATISNLKQGADFSDRPDQRELSV